MPIVPVGARSVAAPGGVNVPADTTKLKAVLHGPFPAAFDVRIHQVAAPEASVTPGLTVHVPVPAPHPAAAAGR